MDLLYHARLLQHYKKPLNHQLIQEYTFEKAVSNHLCGDQATVRMLMRDHQIEAVSIQAKGCVISVASASMISEYIKGKSCIELEKFNGDSVCQVIGMSFGPVRLKCALLSFDGIMQGLQEYCCKK